MSKIGQKTKREKPKLFSQISPNNWNWISHFEYFNFFLTFMYYIEIAIRNFEYFIFELIIDSNVKIYNSIILKLAKSFSLKPVAHPYV